MTGRAARAGALIAGAWILGAGAVPQGAEAQPAVADEAYRPSDLAPAWAEGEGPVVRIDEGHENYHTMGGRYSGFAAVVRADGFRAEAWTERFDRALPALGEILVIANATGATPVDSAFTDGEVEALAGWVAGGGALLLIADHAPFGIAASGLAARLGVEMLDGHVADPAHPTEGLPGPYFVAFERSQGLLGSHPILEPEGLGPIDRVVTFSGQALRGGAGCSPLLRLSDSAELHSAPGRPEDEMTPIGGAAQAVACARGEGRLVVFGEAGMFSAQVIRGERALRVGLPDPFRFGLTLPGTDNERLLRSTLRWLAGGA